MLTSLFISCIGFLYAFALSTSSISVPSILGHETPVILVCAAWAFGIQWLAFIPAYLKQSERFYDLTGSLTYISTTLFILSVIGLRNPRATILAALVMIWSVRLGLFLFKRIKQDGGDGRFDTIKPRFGAFLTAWTLQGFWVLITASAAWIGMLSNQSVALQVSDILGLGIWVLGFSIEVIADRQKRQFRQEKGSAQFIQSGLWRYSRHPNYFGEITLWLGVLILALPTVYGWAYFSIFSPIFVAYLLTKISGVPMLEARGLEKWGNDPNYQNYLATTSCIVPWKLRSNPVNK